MTFVDPNHLFAGRLLIVVPHMDDCVLACGGTIAQLSDKDRVHVVYATDGMRSPAPILPWLDSISPDLGQIRMREARAALGYLGIPQDNIYFLGLPEARLKKSVMALHRSLMELIDCLKPAHILMPFRYDRHPDHLAINRVLTNIHKQGLFRACFTEYFVYYRWRFLPERDIRRYIRPNCLLEVDIRDVSVKKSEALLKFRSQTTNFYSWQTRPILTSVLLEDVAHKPEFFLNFDPSVPGAAVFFRAATWIRLVHRFEPFLKKWHYQVGASLRRMVKKNDL